MANVPADLRYTKEHEWAKLEGDKARVGITAFAQEQLGDVVFVELPKVGAKITAELPKKPEVVNADPYGNGWMIVMKLSNAKEWEGLMTAGDYEKLIADAG